MHKKGEFDREYKMKYSKLLTIILSVTTALFIVSLSIAVPILFRPFYYAQIEPLELEATTELTREEIVTAYNEMLDFCVGLTDEFTTGVLEWSESGKSHFVDVRGLFLLDFGILIVTTIVLLGWMLAKRKMEIRPYRFLNRGPAMWGSVTLIATFLIIGGLAATDFSRAFVVFHSIFFPGKDNWVFDYDTDQIIRILPEVFFRNCAILVLVLILLLCAIGVTMDCWYGRKNKTV